MGHLRFRATWRRENAICCCGVRIVMESAANSQRSPVWHKSYESVRIDYILYGKCSAINN